MESLTRLFPLALQGQRYLETFGGSMPNVVGAWDVNAGKRKDKYLPRTFIGTKGKQVFIFSSNYARQSKNLVQRRSPCSMAVTVC